MNFPITDPIFGRQRCRQWTPLVTQQLRLRHLYQIMAYNISSQFIGSVYYTLHLSTMCAPFYTSEKVDSVHPKWTELDSKNLPHPSISTLVLRIWQKSENDMDCVILRWGINLSGLTYLGNKLSDIQPESFNKNSVIFHMRGGFFTSYQTIRTDLQNPLPFIDNLNIFSNQESTKIYRNSNIKFSSSDVKNSYRIEKLQRLHSLQISIKNQSLDVQSLREKINAKCGLCIVNSTDFSNESIQSANLPIASSPSVHRHTSQLLTMTTLNKMLNLQDKPTKYQTQQIIKTSKLLEVAKFKIKLLSYERERKSVHRRQLKQKCSTLADENEEKESQLMENYRTLSKESEKIREWKKEQIQMKECLLHASAQLQHRRRQLMCQLMSVYPISQATEKKYLINEVYLPSSEMLSDCSDSGLSVALGYVCHILLMCSSFVQVPLRYNITYLGSRSIICDHISAKLNDKDRDFPLYAKGKDRLQFNYAVYLLNKNVAQLRWLCGQYTSDLKATLQNVLALLQGRDLTEDSRQNVAASFEISNLGLQASSTPKTCNVVHENLPNDTGSINTISTPPCKEILNQYPDLHLEAEAFVKHYEGPILDKSTSNSCASSNNNDPILDVLRNEYKIQRSQSPTRKLNKKTELISNRNTDNRPGLSQILAIPEAFLNQQINSTALKHFITTERNKLKDTGISSASNSRIDSVRKASNIDVINKKIAAGTQFNLSKNIVYVEQGTDILHSNLNSAETGKILRDGDVSTTEAERELKQKRHISRSVGSFTEEVHVELKSSPELGSDPLLNVSSETGKLYNKAFDLEKFPISQNTQQEFLQKWLDSSPALVYSEENLYPEEILGSTSESSNTHSFPLTVRTDALLNTTSFNLIKPK